MRSKRFRLPVLSGLLGGFCGLLFSMLASSAPPPAANTNSSDVAINVCVDSSCFRAAAADFEVGNKAAFQSGGGGGASRPTFSELSLIKTPDALSPSLFLWTANGRHLPELVVTITQKNQPAATIKLSDVLVTRFRVGAAVDSGVASETVNFGYAHMCFTVGTSSQCWDVSANTGV